MPLLILSINFLFFPFLLFLLQHSLAAIVNRCYFNQALAIVLAAGSLIFYPLAAVAISASKTSISILLFISFLFFCYNTAQKDVVPWRFCGDFGPSASNSWTLQATFPEPPLKAFFGATYYWCGCFVGESAFRGGLLEADIFSPLKP